jgi:predicted nucleic acid-binding protein
VVANVGNGIFQIPVRLTDQVANVEKLMKKYRDVPMDLADACLVDLADRFETGRILISNGDFEIYRWRVSRKFEPLVAL